MYKMIELQKSTSLCSPPFCFSPMKTNLWLTCCVWLEEKKIHTLWIILNWWLTHYCQECVCWAAGLVVAEASRERDEKLVFRGALTDSHTVLVSWQSGVVTHPFWQWNKRHQREWRHHNAQGRTTHAATPGYCLHAKPCFSTPRCATLHWPRGTKKVCCVGRRTSLRG